MSASVSLIFIVIVRDIGSFSISYSVSATIIASASVRVNVIVIFLCGSFMSCLSANSQHYKDEFHKSDIARRMACVLDNLQQPPGYCFIEEEIDEIGCKSLSCSLSRHAGEIH